MNKLTAQIIAGIGGIYLALQFLPKVSFTDPAIEKKFLYLVLTGAVIGLANFFIKPPLDIITYPLRVLTLGLFSLIVDMGIVWATDILFESLVIVGIVPLFWTTLIIMILSIILTRINFKD
ncbi:MAG: phage holin family protein [Candidatus Paceibacterota bacterium]